MRVRPILLGTVAAIGFALSGCSGGGGQAVSSTPTPPGTPSPTPSNTTITNLQYSQGFAANGASANTAIDLTAKTVTSAAATPSAIQVSYDAAAHSYTVSTTGRSQTFQPGDIQTGTAAGETRYATTGSAGKDYLTLVTTPYSGTVSNRYVGMGYWQRNAVSGSTQTTSFDSFVYGLDTPAGAIPRSGSAGYVTDNFGFVTIPGQAPLAFTGAGTFNVDLALGTFASTAYVYEYELTSARAQSGGSIKLVAGGHLGSGNGFSGNFTYGDTYATMSGTIGGRFFGPNAEELGAAFSASNGSGAVVTGAMTGQASSSAAPVNVSVTNYVADQLYYTSQAMLSIAPSNIPGTKAVNYRTLIGQVQRRLDGSVVFAPGESDFSNATFAASDQIADGRANYITYQKVVNGVTTTLSLFRPGAANSELALTYAGFGSWAGGAAEGYSAFDGRVYFTYGITTPRDLLSRRTGTASYAGVAHGIGATNDGTLYDVNGSSRFAVDFGAQNFNGSLQLSATATGGGSARDLGNWTFSNNLSYGQMVNSDLVAPSGATGALGTISPQFYGPDGEEIAAAFSLQTGTQGAPDTLAIVGATVAKRQ